MDVDEKENKMDTEKMETEKMNMNTKKTTNKGLLYGVIGIVAIAAVAIVAILLLTNSFGQTVAKVGGQKITKDELYNRLVEYYGEQTLDSMIAEKIVDMEIEKNNIVVTDEEIEEEMNDMIESYGGLETVTAQLTAQGLTIDDLKEDVVSYLKTLKLLDSRLTVTDEEVEEFFESNKSYFDQPEKVQASHILVDDEQTALEVKKKLDEGADFAELAAQYSKDTSNAQNGGQLGYFTKGTMEKAFEDAAFSMKVGEISDPVKTSYGYHIIKVTDKQEAKAANLEDSREDIVEILKGQKINSVYQEWLNEKKTEYGVYNSLSNAK